VEGVVLTERGLVVDLTCCPLSEETEVYPGDPPVEAETYATYRVDGFYARRVCFGEHVGTHIDAPAHFVEGGLTVERLPLASLVAPGVALDVSRGSGEVGPEELEEALRECGLGPGVLRGSWLILRLGDRWLGEEAARWLRAHGVVGLGVDSWSPDRDPYPVHRVLLGAGAPILERLRVPGLLLCRGFLLVVAPLPLRGGSGAPARVYALL